MTETTTIPRLLESLADNEEFVAYAQRLRPHDETLDTLARLAWNVIAEPGDGIAHELTAALGVVAALDIAERGTDALTTTTMRPELGEAIGRWQPRATTGTITASIRTAMRTDAEMLLPGDEAWPLGIDDLGAHAPMMLWGRGNLRALPLAKPAVALVGARASTSYGNSVALALASELSERHVAVVSGGAYGIDGAAHRAAVTAGGTTVAYLAGGIDRVYPEGNRELFTSMLERGAIFSEVACGTAPTKWRFLARNRLIATAAATVVVEAGWRSGSLNTAGHAAALARPLGAVPGPVTSSTSAGCHRLLREYDAACITSTNDIFEMLGETTNELFAAPSDPRLSRVIDAMSKRTARTTIDIAARAGLSERDTQSLLALLELEGVVVAPNGRWTLR